MNPIRIKYLDGFRGLAILLVVLFHAYSRWTEFVPYGNRFEHVQIFHKGWLGVQLFFLISGFVILMSLNKCESLWQFLVKRWLRLFPAMCIATVLIFATAFLLPERPLGKPNIQDILPGLLFLPPKWLSVATHSDIGFLEGSFWSLFVEVKFYIVFGLLYFYAGMRKAIWGIFAIYLLWFAVYVLDRVSGSGVSGIAETALRQMGFEHFGWFASGSFAYLYAIEKKINDILAAAVLALVSCFSVMLNNWDSWYVFGWAFLIASVFILTVYSEKMQTIFRFRALLFVGFVSYPFYLIHENALIALTVKFSRIFPDFPAILMPVLPTIFLLAVAYVIAKYLEPVAARFFTTLLERAKIYQKTHTTTTNPSSNR
ncbi:MAG: acyltransferase [Flavobacterium sp.]|uniref:acyltransferase family protein n=1 Tax=Flavobacterium sp. TaxID=239 RepID=UPI0012223CFB|nr:acyltransferase [Flavobacterium sp.]RZJ66064.1 MAG: acyltransferase [Flavobacterium sp.]